MPELKVFPETHVAYVSETGAYHEAIVRGFKRLFAWLAANHIQPVSQSLAIFFDDPTKVAEKKLRCDLCVPVGPQVTGSGEVKTKEIGGWQVATITYEGEGNDRRAYEQLYDWLREQGYHDADAPVEKFLSQLGENLRAEIAVPIAKNDLRQGKAKAAARANESPDRKTTAKKTTKRASSRKTNS